MCSVYVYTWGHANAHTGYLPTSDAHSFGTALLDCRAQERHFPKHRGRVLQILGEVTLTLMLPDTKEL